MSDFSSQKILHVVHCIDTEGPLTEDLDATFDRLKTIFGIDLEVSQSNLAKLQNEGLPLGGIEADVARVVAPNLLEYNNSWQDIGEMLNDAMSKSYREKFVDDFGSGWVYSWHCMDHAGYSDNPRRKDLGYGNVYRFYKQKMAETVSQSDEINWHFHPLSFSRNPLQCATSYINSFDVLTQILCRRVIEEGWFPVANRPGFHTERPDSHWFMEQWIPFDYSNQYYESDDGQPDLVKGRFGDWRRASSSWGGYQPCHDDYQVPGACRRWIFRCLNVGTRFNELTEAHVYQAYEEARSSGSAILAFANHDYRDIRPDVDYVRQLIEDLRSNYPDVSLKFSGAVEAAQMHLEQRGKLLRDDIEIAIELDGNLLRVNVIKGNLFGPQPYLAIKSKSGSYHSDNFDVQVPGRVFTYVLDDHTLRLEQIDVIGIAASGKDGSYDVKRKFF